MSILHKLATSLNRRDEVPNQELAREIATTGNEAAIQELAGLLLHKNKNIRHDSIKVLYEIAEQKPALVIGCLDLFTNLLSNKNNRLQWGAMHALDAVTAENPEKIYAVLPKIIDAADKGSVITRDHAVNILIKLCVVKPYADEAFFLLSEQLLTSPANQLPMYAENALPVINTAHKALFVKTLVSRLNDIEKESKRKRVERVIKKCTPNSIR